MYQLKDLAVMMMYIYIFVITINENNIIAISILIFLGIILFKQNIGIKNSDKITKQTLCNQRKIFIDLISHDLRIPIIAQIRALDLINNEKFGTLNSTQKEMLTQINDSCKCILNLMSLMINTYNLENKSYKLVYENFNIFDAVTTCFDDLLKEAKDKNITFEYNSDNKNINITADKEEFKKVIINILSSAILNAYTKENIVVSVKSFKNKIRLTVAGENENKFYPNTYLKTQFTSIGQNIRMGFCKKIIETHKGKIINCKNKNSFSFELPKFAI